MPGSRTRSHDSTRAYGAGVGMLSLGVGGAGLISYVYFSLASHALSPSEYGRITLLWSAVFITVSVLYRPVEQLLSRTIAERDAHGAAGTDHLRVAVVIELTLGLAFVATALAFRPTIEDELFGGSSALYWILVATVLTYAVSYFARGVLAGRRRFALYGGLIVVESTLRVLFALAVALGIGSGQSAVALGMVVGPAVSLALGSFLVVRVVRSADRAPAPSSPGSPAVGVPASDPSGSTTRAAEPGAAALPALTLRHGGGYAASIVAIMVAEQAFLNAGPLLINATLEVGGAALAGLAFNVLLIARAPLQLFQAVQASILPHLTCLRAHGHVDPFHDSVVMTLAAVGAFATAVALGVLAIGPTAMALLFGGGFEYGRGGLVLVALGMGLYLAASTLTQATLARGQPRRLAAPWLAAAAIFTGLLLTPVIDDPLLRVEASFLAGALVLAVWLYAVYRRGEVREAQATSAGR